MHAEKSLLREYLEALLIAVIFATFARTWVVQAFKIPSGSMEKNLLIGDHILVNKFVYGPTLSPLEEKLLPIRKVRHGDVVVFKYPEDPSRDFIKRCMGLPGDTLKVIDKDLYINGKRVDDSSFTYYADAEIYPRTSPSTPGGCATTSAPRWSGPTATSAWATTATTRTTPATGGRCRRRTSRGGRCGLLVVRQRRRRVVGVAGVRRQAAADRPRGAEFFTLTRWDRTPRIVR